jgi:chromosome segregation ATPase
MSNERALSENDLASSLSQMAENTTTADLVRQQGQSKKVKVLSERKLMAWILALLNQHLAAKEDSFSDQEKEELLRKTQEELAKRIKREQTSEAERNRLQAELQEVMAQISNKQGDQAELDTALAALRARLDEVENANSDLQQDTYDLQDQLQEKLNLLSSTIAEKDHLRDAVRNQMLRSNGLVEGVLGLDSQYYGGRHQEENPVAEDAEGNESFYHDFDVGALIIHTLSLDLEKLRTITNQLGAGSNDQRSLEQDLNLLAQVKAGNLQAMDVAAPVSGLIEALAGTRIEAESLDEAIASATGGQSQPISELPDADGDPAKVIAGATTVVREMASELARGRQRIAALKNMTDEADLARGEAENELEALRSEHRQLLQALAEKAPETAAIFRNEDAGPEAHVAAVQELAAASADELAAVRTELVQLQQNLQQRDAALAAKQVMQTETDAHQRALARVVVEAARGDERLAETAADLALGLEADEALEADFGEQVTQAVTELTRRKSELERELQTVRAASDEARQRLNGIEQLTNEQRQETLRLSRECAQHVADLALTRSETDAANARVEHMRLELDEALHQAHQAKEEIAAAKAKARELEAQAAERIQTDRVLAKELLQTAQLDDLLADVSSNLTLALADESPAHVQQQLTKTVSALAQRQQTLNSDYTRLSHESERHRVEVSESKRALAETQRHIAQALIEAGKDDSDLRDSVSQLEWALERMRPGEPLPTDLLQILNDALSLLAQRKQTLQVERDEIAMHGKEIISALSVTRDQRETELNELRNAFDETNDRLTVIESRTVAAESANRQLAEALSQAALELPLEAEDARIDLELALSQLPHEGEEGIEVPTDVAPQIAAHGARVIAALTSSLQRTTATAANHEAEKNRLSQVLSEQTSAVTRVNHELAALRKELLEARALHGTAATQAVSLQAEVERRQREAATATAAITAARAELAHASELHLTQADDLSLAHAEIEGLRARLVTLTKQLTHAQAEISGFTAQGGASAEVLREDVHAVREELHNERENLKAREVAIVELREKSESAEARLKRLREEFGKLLEERDGVIQAKDRQLDELAERHADVTGMQAQIETLSQQLAQAHGKIQELEALSGIAAGATGRHTNVGSELKRTQAERDLLREQKRSLEADLAESTSRVDELSTQCDQLRKEMLAIREQVEKTLHDERSKSVTLHDENGRLKADNVGLQQRIRKLSGL